MIAAGSVHGGRWPSCAILASTVSRLDHVSLVQHHTYVGKADYQLRQVCWLHKMAREVVLTANGHGLSGSAQLSHTTGTDVAPDLQISYGVIGPAERVIQEEWGEMVPRRRRAVKPREGATRKHC